MENVWKSQSENLWVSFFKQEAVCTVVSFWKMKEFNVTNLSYIYYHKFGLSAMAESKNIYVLLGYMNAKSLKFFDDVCRIRFDLELNYYIIVFVSLLKRIDLCFRQF